MPLRLEIKKHLSARSERVKSVDFHPTEPWLLASLYSGHLFIWNYETCSLVKSLEVCDLPLRTAKFIPHQQWIVCGADDMHIRVYNYNTMERVRVWEAHADYIRSLAVHPSLPLLLSSSDDMLIKLWDWEKGWECVQVFEGHTHYVMQVEFNPKDSNTFASASLDRTVKVWGLNSPVPHFSLEGHERGVNCVSYFRGGDRPYLVSGADDHTVRIWDYQTKSCVATLEGHSNNISSVHFHPQLPIILSASEDGTVRIWHANTYRLENTLNYGLERAWSLCCLKGSNKVGIGYDDGTIMIKIGHEEPVASMERGGKLVWANNQEIVTANVKTASDVSDGDRLPLGAKELGACELYPQQLIHSPNGRLLCACGDGEYIIYTALSLKNKSFGSALEFVWAEEAGVYATRESSSKVKIFKNFKEHHSFRPPFAAEGIFGGALLGVRSADFIDLYDWDECRIIRRIDVVPRKVFWSESGELLVLACESAFYVLRYNKELVSKFQTQGVEVTEQGIEGAFELEQEVGEKIRGATFVGDILIYTNTAGRLNYYVGGEVLTLAHLTKPMYLLGYLPKENRVYLMDKQHHTYSYSLLLSTLVYQTAIVRRDFDAASKALPAIPKEQLNKIARFLESQDLKEMALEVTLDPEHKFELAISCKKLPLARQILADMPEAEDKWKLLGDAALHPPADAPHQFDLKLAEEAYVKANDLGGLLLVYSSLGDAAGMERLAQLSESLGRNNVAFLCYFLLHRVDKCISLLCATDRIPEAAFLTRTYAPSRISDILAVWKDNLKQVSVKAAEALADPTEYQELFPDLEVARQVERWLQAEEGELMPAILYGDYAQNMQRNLIQDMKEGTIQPVIEQQMQQMQQQQSRQVEAPVHTFAQQPEPSPVQVQASPVQAESPAPPQQSEVFSFVPQQPPQPLFTQSPTERAEEPAVVTPVVSSPAVLVPSPAAAPLTSTSPAAAPAFPQYSPSPAAAFTPSPSPAANVFANMAYSPAATTPVATSPAAASPAAAFPPAAVASATAAPSASPMSFAPSPVHPGMGFSTSPAAAQPSPSPATPPSRLSDSPSGNPLSPAPLSSTSPLTSASPQAAFGVTRMQPSPVASAVAAPLAAPAPSPVYTAPAPSPAAVSVASPAASPAAASFSPARPVASSSSSFFPAPAAAPSPAAASSSATNLDQWLASHAEEGSDDSKDVDVVVPSLDEINNSLAELEGDSDDFGDFE